MSTHLSLNRFVIHMLHNLCTDKFKKPNLFLCYFYIYSSY